MLISDASNRILWANQAAGELLGWPLDELIGQPITVIVPQRMRSAHREGFRRYMTSGHGALMGRPLAVSALRRDGREERIEILLAPLKGPERRVVASLRSVETRIDLERRSALVSRLLGILAEGGALTEVAPQVLEAIADGLGWPYAALWVVDYDEWLVRMSADWIEPGSGLEQFGAVSRETIFAIGDGIPGRTVASGETQWVGDVAADPDFPRRDAARMYGVTSALLFPVRSQGRVLGVIELMSKEERRPDNELREALEAIGVHFGGFVRHRLAEEVVHAERQRFDMAMEAGRLATWEWNLESDELHWAARIDRSGHSGPRGRSFSDALEAVHPDDRDRVASAFRDAAAGRSELSISYQVVWPDEQVRWIEVAGRLLSDVAGRKVLSGVVADVTERKASEGHRELLLRQVQSAQERLELLAEASSKLAASLDYRTTLGQVAQLAVPVLADWCLIHGVRDNGELQLLGIAHLAELDAGAVNDLHTVNNEAPRDLFGLGTVLETGKGLLHREVTPALLRDMARDGPHLAALERLGWHSVLVVPLIARGRKLGALTWATTGGRRYDEQDLTFAAQLASRAAMAVDNARLFEDQATTARTLQDSLLPPDLPTIPGIEVAASYRPAGRNQVAGDFYDLFPLRGDSWGIVMGDVRGKGVGAAAVTALARWTLRAAAMQASSPPRVLGLLNEAMLRRTADDEDPRFCTALFARLRPVDQGAMLSLSCGGHPLPLVLRRGGAVEELGVPGVLVGAFEDAHWQTARTLLHPGDVVLLYTDGITEARIGDDLYGEERLRAVVEECVGLPAREVVERVVKRMERIARPRDDVALLALRVRE